jgi:hypothetical protein
MIFILLFYIIERFYISGGGGGMGPGGTAIRTRAKTIT